MCLNEIRNDEVYTGKLRNQEVTQFRSLDSWFCYEGLHWLIEKNRGENYIPVFGEIVFSKLKLPLL